MNYCGHVPREQQQQHIPVVLRSIHEVIDLGIDELEYALLGSLLIVPEFFCGHQCNGATSRCR